MGLLGRKSSPFLLPIKSGMRLFLIQTTRPSANEPFEMAG
jgi:hypothetical protein